MKPLLCTALPVSCFGNSSATCERVLSGAKGCARKAFALLFVFSLAFSLPVSAGVLDEYSCVVNLESQTFGLYESMSSAIRHGFSSVPASFSYSFSEGANSYFWEWEKATALTYIESIVTLPNKQIQFIINVGDGQSDLPVELEHCSFDFLMRGYNGTSVNNFYYGLYGYATIESDLGDFSYSVPFGEYDFFPVFENLNFTCSQYFTVTYYSSDRYEPIVSEEFDAFDQVLESELKLFIEGESVSLDSISIQISDLKDSVDNIGSSVGDIKATVENIQEGVVEINGTVTDMKEQLEEPDSPIWSAAGEKIADTIKEVFVPSEEEMQAEKQELENLLDDKLGDAKVLLDQGETLVTDIRNIIGDMDPGTSVHFPGISLPMNGETYVIVPEQDVKLRNSAFVIFQDALGMGITVLCWWSILHICEDLLYCLISGVSYWGFIRSRHDK